MLRWWEQFRGVPLVYVGAALVAFITVGIVVLLALTRGGGSETQPGLAVYQDYAKDYVPIEEHLRVQKLGLTAIYDRDGPDRGSLLGTLTISEQLLFDPVSLDSISDWMVLATISSDDTTFFDNPGVDFLELVSAFYEDFASGELGSGSGESSITQQLVRNVYLCPSVRTEEDQYRCGAAERTRDGALREMVYAIELTKNYTKEQILEWYLNQISYADRYIGVEAAAQGYFHKDAGQLTLAESAMLAGIPAFPTLYHPRLNCVQDADNECILDEAGRMTVGGNAKERQESVLDLMVVHGRATRTQVVLAKAETLKVYEKTNTIVAAAWIDNQVEPRLVRMCNAGLLPLIDGADDCAQSVHTAGYAVTTTLDWELTESATALIQEYIQDGLDNGCECHNGAIVTIEPESGQVIVYAPNIDPNEQHDDRMDRDPRVRGEIDQLTVINQPGSAFMPVAYLAWFDVLGKAPLSTLWDTSPLEISGGAQIANPRPSPGTEGLISAKAALGGSQNVPAFRAAQEAGVENVIAMAKALGITTLEQSFDPTWRSHQDMEYGAAVAIGGANISAIDMAYMNATIANIGTMVGVEHLAQTMDMGELKSLALDEGEEYLEAQRQSLDFSRGHTRVPGTRELDPIVILEVRDIDDQVIFQQGEPERRQVVDAGSVWLLHSIMSDCTARFIIWGCGSSNDDLRLDFFMEDGQRVPSGVKIGAQEFPQSPEVTLETWMTGYTRYAATAVWVGNANNGLVRDGPSVGYASSHATVWLWKTWMGAYHDNLQARGLLSTPDGFAELQPANVDWRRIQTVTTDGRLRSGDDNLSELCYQTVEGWVRTDIEYEGECEEAEIDVRNGLLASSQTPAQFREIREFVKLPLLKPDLAEKLAEYLGIPLAPTEPSAGQ